MPRRVQMVRRDGASMANTTGREGEIMINLSRFSAHIHDGITRGGIELARADGANAQQATVNNNGIMTIAQVVELGAIRVSLNTETAARITAVAGLETQMALRPTITQMNTADAATLAAAIAALAAYLPIGSVIMWHGLLSAVPAGWAVCDGFNGTPDLRDRFVVGSGNLYGLNATGGSPNAVIVSHNHSLAGAITDAQGAHTHTATTDALLPSLFQDNGGDGGHSSGVLGSPTGNTRNVTVDSAGNHQHNVSGSTTTTGVSGVNANLPPFYGLFFIKRIA